MADSDPDIRWMTYTEAAIALGVDRETVARRARRRKWAKQAGNDGKPRVAVPVNILPPIPDTFPGTIPDIAAISGPSIPDINPPQSPIPDTSGLILALASQAQAATERADRLEAALIEATRKAAEAEGEAKILRDALAREVRQLEQAEIDRRAAETQREAVQMVRFNLQAELAAWTAGGPVARAWRAFLNRRGGP